MTTAASLTRAQAATDILLVVAAAFVAYTLEETLRGLDLFPFPPAFDGVLTLVAAFVAAVAVLRWRGHDWSRIGLRKPPNWWFIPVWAVVVLVVYAMSQNTLVPFLAGALQLDPPDFSRYDVIYQNLPMLLLIASGAMLTGGFIEEFLYRGLMIDRLSIIFGGGRIGLVAAALLNGLPFGLIHFEWGIGGIQMTTVMGSVLGLMFLATRRNLWPLIVAHATLDAVLMTLLYFGIRP